MKFLIILLGIISAYIGVAYRPYLDPWQVPIWFALVVAVTIYACLELHRFCELCLKYFDS